MPATIRKTIANEFKKIPNIITLIRLCLIPFMYYFSFKQEKIFFLTAFLLFGFGDFLDGFFARMLKQTSAFGNDFDGFTDRLFYFSLIPFFYFIENKFLLGKINEIIALVAVIVIIQIINLIIYRKTFTRHTYTAKIAAFLVYCAMLVSFFTGLNNWLFYPVYFLVVIACVEELILSILKKDVKIKTIFEIKK